MTRKPGNRQHSAHMQQCIENCQRCHEVCWSVALNHCLEVGGEHVAPEHFRLMMGCAKICATAADLMLASFPLHAVVCGACAEICDRCAADCERVGDMDECVAACGKCADSCREMAAA